MEWESGEEEWREEEWR
jgi:hypothetical protein